MKPQNIAYIIQMSVIFLLFLYIVFKNNKVLKIAVFLNSQNCFIAKESDLRIASWSKCAKVPNKPSLEILTRSVNIWPK